MNGHREGEPIVRPMRPQYHFFYGATSPGDAPSAGDPRSTHTEHESLIGECLVPTDNEEEPPTTTTDSFDLQQVLISNGDNGGMRHVVGVNGGPNHKRKSLGSGADPSQDNKSLAYSLLHCQGKSPMVHIVGLVGCMTVCMVILVVNLFPSGSETLSDSMGSSKPELVKQFVQSFPIIDRSKSKDPTDLFINKDLFHPDLYYSGSDLARIFNFAFPTGAFWTNLVLPPTADRGFSYPIVVYPYAYKWSDRALVVSYPYNYRKEENIAIHDYFQPDLTFGVTQDTQSRYITNFDPLSVTLQYTSGSGSWKSYLVQGSPYVTIEYNSATPTIRALSTFKTVACPGEESLDSGEGGGDDFQDDFMDDDDVLGTRRRLLGVCGATSDNEGNIELRGVQFVLQSQEGINWMLFSSEPITFLFDTRIRTMVESSRVFKGTLRAVIIPTSSKVGSNSNGMAKISSSTGLRRLVYHASIYPIGAKVSYDFVDPSAKTTVASAGKSILSGITGTSGGTGGTGTGGTGTGSALTSTKKTDAQPTVSGQRVARVTFQFQTKGGLSNANTAAAATGKTTSLLMLSLPHHAFSFQKSHTLDAKHFDLTYHCIKGALTPVVGSVWSYEENLFTLGFDDVPGTGGGQATTNTVLSDKRVRTLLADNLETDLKIAPPTKNENIYGYGKQIARLAQLAHIADRLVRASTVPVTKASNSSSHGGYRQLGSNSNSPGESSNSNLDFRLLDIRNKAANKLLEYLEMLLTQQVQDCLLYDASLGGLISTNGLADFNADFGNGRYNDHHFHYGYLLYASAVMGKLNATFIEQHGNKVDSIMHDVAYNSLKNDGSFFPLARHMSWFDGHSYASGLFPFGNGKSQESSSEAVNCYYGAYLWSLVKNGYHDNPSSDTSATTDFARLLLAMEIRGAQTYWHMLPPKPSNSSNTTVATTFPTIYSPHFSKNYMVGNVGMLDVICSTWFGTQNLYVHMINFLPVTSITRKLFNKEYVKEEYANVISNYPNAEMAWKGYVVSDHALVDPNEAWKEALSLQSAQLDSGFSKTQALYFILTSPDGFDLSQISGGGTDDSSSRGGSSRSGGSSGSGSGRDSDDGACVNHEACLDAGLQGLCCPTTNGMFLGCCSSQKSSKAGSSSTGDQDNASCSNHKACSGLVGLCCPTGEGVFLGCCDGT